MLQVARLAPTLLGDSADLVPAFLRRSLNPDGGFRNRAGESDLYYTVFGLEGLLAFGEAVPAPTHGYVARFGSGDALDLVHLSSLARCWASVAPGQYPAGLAASMQERIEAFRTADGGYAVSRGSDEATVYASFLALGATEDVGSTLPAPDAALRSVARLRAADGGYANHRGAANGSTPATAAAVMILRHLDAPVDALAAEWLLARRHPGGGFAAAPAVPLPDLLSTATALHALAALGVPLDPVRECCLDFLDTLWSSAGGFHGSWADDTLDCEYTYYGLLALGHLSL